MDFVDIIFPQKVSALTYRVPEKLRGEIRPGMQVAAELGKTVKTGIVLGEAGEFPRGKTKPIADLLPDAPELSIPLLELIRWMAGYYIALEGTVLKSILPGEFFKPVKRRAGGVKQEQDHYNASTSAGIETEGLDEIKGSIEKEKYGAYLLHAPATDYERAYLARATSGIEGLIVAAPDLAAMRLLEGPLRESYGDRLVLYHSGLNKGARTEAITAIASGEAHAVLGSLMAVHAPLPCVRMIALTHEESTLYKNESAPRSNARDAGVMRAYLEGATVLLSSICPSVESWHNAQTGKYTLIDHSAKGRRPMVRVMGLYDKDGSLNKNKGTFSRKLISAVERAASEGGRALLYVNRKGHSTLRCAECGHIDLCPACKVPLVFHKKGKTLLCALCGSSRKTGDTCPSCQGHSFEHSGVGLERIEEEFKAMRPVGVDTKTRDRIQLLLDDEARMAVGTRTLTRSDALSHGFQVVGVVNADSFMYQPDFRAAERAMQDFMYAADKTAPEGELIIQTRRPRSILLANLRRFNLNAFYKREVEERKEPGFPPFTRIALLSIKGDKKPDVDPFGFGDAMALGPVSAVDRKGKKIFKLLIKAATSSILQQAIRKALKQLKGRLVDVDVDPLEL
ncbi:MAG: primosomal protein N' [Thermodesulfovibrionales bacterium]|nr:primosomal protein N' [Thermodesulfovibrionales bacterium]